MEIGFATSSGRASPAACHLLVELDLSAPFWQYQRLHEREPYSFLLDSAMPSTGLGRYSFLGGDPFLVYKARRVLRPGAPAIARIETTRRRDRFGRPLVRPIVETREADLFDDLRETLGETRIDRQACADGDFPLLAGAVGYFGYEAGHFVEDLPDRGRDDLDLPDVYLTFHDCLLVHEHTSGKTFLSVVGRGATDTQARDNAWRTRDEMLARIEAFDPRVTNRPVDRDRGSPAADQVDLHAQFDLESYCRLIDFCQRHIFAGDVFEVCLTHRLDAPFAGDPWRLYEALRGINPAPFAAYLHMPEAQVISSSPERYARLTEDRIAESRPIKGTRRRGATTEDDDAIRRGLAAATKDRAENVMIVDLVRNDLGRVCKLGTIHVPELMVVEPYATVFQLVSTIRGELEDSRDALDLVRASFPGGSMTGAPKIEAMKIIDRLEPVKRGVYSGAIGYLDFAGTMDLSITIRTFVVHDRRAYFSVGGAIVADSVPRNEYFETLDKAQALIAALANATTD
jgi:aminodeoxychorismate synthase component I